MERFELADHVRGISLGSVLEHFGFNVRREGSTLRAKDDCHNIVVTGSRWFDNKENIGGRGAIDLVIHLRSLSFSAACQLLAKTFGPIPVVQSNLSFPRSWQQSPQSERNLSRSWLQNMLWWMIPIGP